MSVSIRIFSRNRPSDPVTEAMLWQQVTVRRVYLDFLYDSSARVVVAQGPFQIAEVVLLELIPFDLLSRPRYPGSLLFRAEPIPLWSANIERLALGPDAQAAERLRLNVMPESVQRFPMYDKRVRVNVEDVLQSGFDHE